MAFDPPPVLKDYLLQHTSGFTSVFRQLYEDTEALGEPSVMMLGHEQVAFFQLLVSLTNARRVLDLGTFTGISALAFATALGGDGRVVTVDRNPQWVDFARPYWQRAGVADRIEPVVGEAVDVLRSMRERSDSFDVVFIDVDKRHTARYVDESLAILAPRGVVLVDNALWHGWVLDDAITDADTEGMRSFNRQIRSNGAIDVAMLPLGDGLTILRRPA